MNIFHLLKESQEKNRVIRWIHKYLVLNAQTREFHFTEAQRGVLQDHGDKERYYKMNRQSGKSTLLKSECLYYAFKHAYSVHLIFAPSRTQASAMCTSFFETLTASGLAHRIIQRSVYKITLDNHSEILFVTPVGFEQTSCGINMKDKKRFVYCDEVTDVSPRLAYARMINARFLAFSSLTKERIDT